MGGMLGVGPVMAPILPFATAPVMHHSAENRIAGAVGTWTVSLRVSYAIGDVSFTEDDSANDPVEFAAHVSRAELSPDEVAGNHDYLLVIPPANGPQRTIASKARQSMRQHERDSVGVRERGGFGVPKVATVPDAELSQ
ncbi:hypothetical protein NMY22_g8885 [Coprinellus aureogranulatus]|nr:hypothetical protein NMY22_g8885 [Coprinellus aureogranulatus]